MSPSEAEDINAVLLRDYGRLYDQPRFRLSWSEDQFETRVGNVSEFYGSIFVRETSGAHYLKKYGYIKDRWVLEHVSVGLNSELLQVISYEPLFVFQTNKGVYLEPITRAIRVMIDAVLNPLKLTPGAVLDEEEKQFQKEIAFIEDYLTDVTDYIPSMLANKEAIVVPALPPKD